MKIKHISYICALTVLFGTASATENLVDDTALHTAPSSPHALQPSKRVYWDEIAQRKPAAAEKPTEATATGKTAEEEKKEKKSGCCSLT